jgi:hypothetical protein
LIIGSASDEFTDVDVVSFMLRPSLGATRFVRRIHPYVHAEGTARVYS